jgi:hypothetical protein
MRVVVYDDAGRKLMVYEADGSGSYPADSNERTKVIDAMTHALRYLLNKKKGMLNGEV